MAEQSSTIKTIFALDGERKYKDAMRDITTQQKALQSEMRLATEQYKLNGDKQEYTRQKTEILKKQIELQKKAVNEAKNALQQANEKFGEGSAQAQKYKAEVGFAEVSLGKLEKQLQETSSKLVAVGQKMQTAGDTASKIGGKLSTTLTPALLAAAGASVKFAADAEAMNAQFDQTFGDAADNAQKEIEALGKEFGMLPNRIKPAFTQTTSQFKGLGANVDEAMLKASMATTIAADASAYFDKSMEDAQGSLNSFIKGSYEGGEAIGIFANETQMANYASEKLGLEWKNLSEKDKQFTRLEFARAMQEAAGAAGQAARESDSLANQTGNLKQQFQDVAADFGKQLLPIAKNGIEIISGLAEKFSGLDDNTQKWILSIGAVAAAAGPVLKVGGTLSSGIGKLAEKIGKGDTGLAGNAKGLAKNAGLVSAALIAAAAATALIYEAATKTSPKVKELADNVKDNEEAYKNNTLEIEANADVARTLTSQLEELSKKENKSNLEKEQMQSLVSQLNEIYPDLNLQYNREVDNLNMSTAKLYENIDARERRLLLGASESALLQNMQEEQKILAEQAATQQKINAYIEQGWVALDSSGHYKNIASGLDGASWQDNLDIGTTIRDFESLNKTLDSTRETTKILRKSYEDNMKAMDKTGAESNKKIVQSHEETQEAIEESLEDQEKALIEYQKAVESEKQKHMNLMNGLDEKSIYDGKISAAQYLKNLNRQKEDFKRYSADMVWAASKLPPDIYERLKALGPNAAQVLSDMRNMSDIELQQFILEMGEAATLANSAVNEEMMHLPEYVAAHMAATKQTMKNEKPNFRGAGRELGSVTTEGMQAEMWRLREAGKTGAKGAVEGIKEGGSGSYGAGTTIGSDSMIGTSDAIKNGEWRAENAMNNALKTVSNKRHSAKEFGRPIGSSLIDGAVEGINDNAWRLSRAGSSSVTGATTAMRRAAESRSPSRVTMRIGEDMGEGVIVGFKNKTEEVNEASGEFIASAINTIKDAQSNARLSLLSVKSLVDESLSTQETRTGGGSQTENMRDAWKETAEQPKTRQEVHVHVELDKRELGKKVIMYEN